MVTGPKLRLALCDNVNPAEPAKEMPPRFDHSNVNGIGRVMSWLISEPRKPSRSAEATTSVNPFSVSPAFSSSSVIRVEIDRYGRALQR